MKTQTLLIAAAALVAGVMSSHAQVYSQNIVGYVNVTLVGGQNNLIANQLDLDGTGTNNTLASVFGTSLPNNATLSAWNGSGFDTATYSTSSGWSTTSDKFVNEALQPGVGFFIKTKASTNVTFVGNVLIGTNTVPVVAGVSVLSPLDPIAGTLDTTNRFPIANNNTVNVFNGSGFTSYTFSATGGWTPSDPQLTIGQSVFVNIKKSTNWTQILNVQ
jgi:hypothetical protein